MCGEGCGVELIERVKTCRSRVFFIVFFNVHVPGAYCEPEAEEVAPEAREPGAKANVVVLENNSERGADPPRPEHERHRNKVRPPARLVVWLGVK